MRYSEIINENTDKLYVTSKRHLKTMLTYNEVNPQNGKLIIDIKGLREIIFPPGFTVNGNMKIQRKWKDDLIEINLLGDLTVHGNLDLSALLLRSLPEKLYVDNDLDLVSATINKMPKELTVGGYVHTVGSNITVDDIHDRKYDATAFTGDYGIDDYGDDY